MAAIAKRDEHFPALSGDILHDTEELIGELRVGAVVVERGMARLYLIWKSRHFLNAVVTDYKCPTCGFESSKEAQTCPRCSSTMVVNNEPLFPTLESYVGHVADETSKSRQTLFNRLKVYRVLCDERGVHPGAVFELNLMSPGAARKLASVDEDNEHVTLENNSWEDTVDVALKMDTKSAALEYVKYDVLHEPKIVVEYSGDENFTVYREYDVQNEDGSQYVVEEYTFALTSNWPEEMRQWLAQKIGAKI